MCLVHTELKQLMNWKKSQPSSDGNLFSVSLFYLILDFQLYTYRKKKFWMRMVCGFLCSLCSNAYLCNALLNHLSSLLLKFSCGSDSTAHFILMMASSFACLGDWYSFIFLCLLVVRSTPWYRSISWTPFRQQMLQSRQAWREL